jgi:isocitrate dehydrogenase
VAGNLITYEDGELKVPDRPEIPYITGDGIGPEVMAAALPVLDAAVEVAYGDKRGIDWIELPAGQSAFEQGLELLPQATVDAIREHRVAIKGPTMTPVGGGHRSINVTLRQILDLYACVRPVRYFEGVAAPVRDPAALDVTIFRENTEDVYAGIEYAPGSEEAKRIEALVAEQGKQLKPDTGVGIKVISKQGTQRLVRAAIEYALERSLKRVTLVHKGNIMKQTEGAFRAWGFDLAREEYAGSAVVAADIAPGEPEPEGLVIVDDRIADAMFQELLLRPAMFDVIAAPNLNGDYLSDACAAQVGGLGIAPGGNIGAGIAVFEATHGTAPDIAGRGIANPGSAILSGAMMLEFLGWPEAAALVVDGFARVLASGRLTCDLAAERAGATELGTSEFGAAVTAALRR